MINARAIGQNFAKSIVPENRYTRAARNKKNQLSNAIHNAFEKAKKVLEDIRPDFAAAVGGVIARMDKISGMGKGGQLAWAPSGIKSGGNNLMLRIQRSLWRKHRAAQLKSTAIIYS